MGVCRQYRISHSHFLGGPPRWDEDDQDKAIAHENYIRAACGECGTRLSEWEEDPDAFVGYHWRCPGCEIIEQERDNVPEDQKGIHVGVIPRDLSDQVEAEAKTTGTHRAE